MEEWERWTKGCGKYRHLVMEQVSQGEERWSIGDTVHGTVKALCGDR